MGHRSRFRFPVPGRKAQELPAQSIHSGPLSKAQKILGTGQYNVEPATISKGDAVQQWDSNSGISISLSESSASHTTNESNLEIVNEEGDNGTIGASHGRPGWDAESDIIPRQMHSGKDLKGQKSAATIGHDYRTDASSLLRRRSNASTIQTHYDRSKVPLSVSQQTSNSAMAKGLPTKANAILGIDGTLPGSIKKKKPLRLDFSILRPRSRKESAAPVLGNTYVVRSPSLMSQVSSRAPMPSSSREIGQNTSRRIGPSPRDTTGTNTPQTYRPRGATEAAGLPHLYNHYEQKSFGETPSSPALAFPVPPRFESHGTEPTPPLTAASTLTSPITTPISNLPIRDPKRSLGHSRKESSSSRNTVTTAHSSNALPLHLSPRHDYASSVSSRYTRTSKTSRTDKSIQDLDLQQSSVLSLSDSESDDGAFSDSAPKSSMSSHDNASHDDVSVTAEPRKLAVIRPPVIKERISSKQTHTGFAPLNDYLTNTKSSDKSSSNGHSPRAASSSTLHSTSSSASTATATGNSKPASRRASALSVFPQPHDAETSARRRTGYGIHEAKAIVISPVQSSAKDVLTSPVTPMSMHGSHEASKDYQPIQQQHGNSDQPTPPLSPTGAEFNMKKPDPPPQDLVVSEDNQGLNSRLMAVTKQEEMLLAALRKKRAMMRENIIAEFEGERNSMIGPRERSKKDDATAGKLDATPSRSPQLPQLPKRNSSLFSAMKHLTMQSSSSPHSRSESQTSSLIRFADLPPFDMREGNKRRSSSAVSSNTGRKSSGSSQHHQEVLMYLDRPLSGIETIDTAESSPDPSEIMDFNGDSDDEILPEQRRSRRWSKYGGPHGNAPSQSGGRRGSERPRADSNSQGQLGCRSQLEDLPEWTGDDEVEYVDGEFDGDFDGFSDVMFHSRSVSEHGIARPDSPVSQMAGQTFDNKEAKRKNSTLRLSAVGHGGQPLEAGLWGDDG